MVNELAPTITFASARPSTSARGGPLSWRLAAPLIGTASIGLWMLVGKAVLLLTT